MSSVSSTHPSTAKSPSSKGISRRHHVTLQMTSTKRNNAVKRTASGVSAGSTSSCEDLKGLSSLDMHESDGKITISSELQSVPAVTFESQGQVWRPKWLSILDNPSLSAGRALVVFAAAIYGTNFATVKLLDDAIPLSISAALRFGLASSVVSAVVLNQETDDIDPMVAKERNLAFWSGMEVGVWYCIGYIAQAEGLQTVEAGKSAFFNSLAVIVVPILDVIFKGKILRQQELASVGLACLGVGLLELGPSGGLHITFGDLLAMTQTLFFGVGYWRLEAVSHAHPHQSARITVGLLAAVAGGSILYALTEFGLGHLVASVDDFFVWLGDPFIILALLWTGLISTALALYLETVALKVVSASELTLLMTTVSLWGAGFAFVVIGEILTPTGMVGGMLILLGCLLGNLSPKQNKQTLPISGNFELDP